MKKIYLILLWGVLSLFPGLYAQTTDISGIVNLYEPVSAIGCNTVSVGSNTDFAPGARVLLIQMKGAECDVTNTAAFGSIIDNHDAGNFEFNTVASTSGATGITMVNGWSNTYDPSTGTVQLILVPQYVNANVVAPLTGQAWNGTTGGVLTIDVSGTLTLFDNVTMDALGFRGGTLCTNPDGGCGASPPYLDYSYLISSGFGAEKGEGVAIVDPLFDGGRGAWATGGGGGNKHNSGGGGGSNWSAGGTGGNTASFCSSVANGGIGGYPADYSSPRIYLGGGGGSSDYNDGVGTFGGNGGGIIIIRAGTLDASGQTITANGEDVLININSIGDGAGGGGAGGSILMDVGAYTGFFSVEAIGGDGGSQNTSWSACFGPGGGGGSGPICSAIPFPASVTAVSAPGRAGVDLNPFSACFLTTYGATDGDSDNIVSSGCSLPEADGLCGCDLINLNAAYTWSMDGNELTVTDISTGSPVTFVEVDFGDGYSTLGLPGAVFTHTYSAMGDYLVCLHAEAITDEGLCCDDDTCIVITVDSCAMLSSDFAAVHDPILDYTYTFTDMSSPTSSVSLWDFGDGGTGISAGTGSTVTHTYAPGTGIVNVTLVNMWMLYDDSICCIDTIVIPLKVLQTVFGKMALFPNPASNKLNVQFETDGNAPAVLSIYDPSGRKVMVKDNLWTGTQEIDISRLPVGAYIIEIMVGDKPTIARFTKE